MKRYSTYSYWATAQHWTVAPKKIIQPMPIYVGRVQRFPSDYVLQEIQPARAAPNAPRQPGTQYDIAGDRARKAADALHDVLDDLDDAADFHDDTPTEPIPLHVLRDELDRQENQQRLERERIFRASRSRYRRLICCRALHTAMVYAIGFAAVAALLWYVRKGGY